ncbi:MAG: pyridoxine 5'-phosphate synthase [Oceanococcus sp.]
MSQPESPIRLGVNIDHVATLRQQRGTLYPSPLAAAFVAQSSGADGITAHLREDRRHIQERDVQEIRQALGIPLNLELALADEVLAVAESLAPPGCCIVPERRDELTTEGGLDVAGQLPRVRDAIARLNAVGTRCSLFIEADPAQIDAALAAGAQVVEFHTGAYADAVDAGDRSAAVQNFQKLAEYANAAGLEVHAGHGLTVDNVVPIARIPQIAELNIGHSIVSDAVIMGMAAAVARMKAVIMQARSMPSARSAI